MEFIGVIVLVVSFLFLLVIGVPIAFSIGIAGVLTMLVSIDALPAFTTYAQRMATGLDSFALLAIPFFILAGNIMNQGGIAMRLINLAKILVGKWPAGLAFVNVFANMLFGAISGSAAASASAIGSIMGPEMKKDGYDEHFSAAVNISSATTGLSIPPSNILIVYSLASGGVSITALFLAGYIPGILTGLAIMLLSMGLMVKYNKGMKAAVLALTKVLLGASALFAVGIGFKELNAYSANLFTVGMSIVGLLLAGLIARTVIKRPKGVKRGLKILWDAIPSLFLLIVVIGGIVGGVFTATEASAVAVFYALVLSMLYKEISLKDLP
ncbi:MAG: TRAP transporter large permease subunit, partial [Carboxylicivirga sp.]|nr:TRAP transporter large permease subunit [Carboxylicivirga sp.]